MCVANLNVTLQPCSHRWYTLVRPCAPEVNLSNCSEKLRLEGWETRNDNCPWCGSQPELDDATHKLFGGSTSRSRANSTAVSSSSPLGGDRRTSSATTSSSSLSRSSSRSADDDFDVDTDPGAKARMMNYRLNYYMFRNPEREEWIKKDEEIAALPEDSEAATSASSLSRRGSKLGKTWRKSVKLGRGMFKA